MTPAGPEDAARAEIDRLLAAAGWVVQDYPHYDRHAAAGVAVREFQLPAGPSDYLLFVDGKAAGVIEAKREGTTLSGVEEQSEGYAAQLPDNLAKHADPLPFTYESTGVETFFSDGREQDPRARRVFAFHRPETLRAWLAEGKALSQRVAEIPPLERTGLRDCQFDAIDGLERSLARGDTRALIQMATGAGKTFTAVTFAYRLIKFARAKRILFLVDRRALGKQTLTEFSKYVTPDDGRVFTSLYNVQHLQTNRFDRDAKVVITTIQRLYAMLRDEELDPENEEESDFERGGPVTARTVSYNPEIPIESFDFIVTDECHRSIYNLWRQVLEYFDARLIGLTATPSRQTLGFFRQNLVTEYPYERSVADGVNVGFDIYKLRTQVGTQGATVEAGWQVAYMDRRTRMLRWEQLDEDLEYQASQLDRSVVTHDQIRTVLTAYRNKLREELFPDRTWVPKTLIFAKDDNHAENIVRHAREVFGKGNDFVKKITYRTSGEKPEGLITSFRNDPYPRIAVTVDMISTGTDIRPIEVVIFMRDVRSEIYFEQMKGRGARTISDTDLRQVTPDAHAKTRFLLIDAVGVSDSRKSDNQPLERRRSVSFQRLLQDVAAGNPSEDTLSSLAGRLSRLDREVSDEDRARIKDASGGEDLRHLSNHLLDAIDPDTIETRTREAHGPTYSDQEHAAVAEDLRERASRPFAKAELREAVMRARQRADLVIDEVTQDVVTEAGFDLERAQETTQRFKQFIEDNKANLTALQILYERPYGQRHLTYDAVRELADKLRQPPYNLNPAHVWQAFRRLDESRVRGAGPETLLTNIVSLVWYAMGEAEELEPFPEIAERRFQAWLQRQRDAGRDFSAEQLEWLTAIKDHLAANAEISREDFKEHPDFTDRGGLVKVRQVFGNELDPILEDLQESLVA
ncbi:type I restriction-modification enzyme R subunit C-terminal domain-containing protein [Ferruginivarius sediminum]|uniref:Restriction endonuclease subunit R n=1 Tax=Ferruginivarius sediminum TaxID=2661937 RepID=A0A369TCG2_9PROT|nr:type I restriction-modification enzyme R subunit C-terminal domain-containing protein [Ferruginivarius sediminum]RDD60596.1 restriction endonuclease subunit R [Ferruginivarius sediminum]